MTKTLKTLVLIFFGAILPIVIYYMLFFKAEKKTLNLDYNTEMLIERGRYLSNHVYVCFECHTPRNWDLFSGPPINSKHGIGGELMQAHTQDGIFYISNITPFALESFSDEELKNAITVGYSKDNKPLYWGMPSFKYNTMPIEDLDAIVAYLRTIPAIENEIPPSKPDTSILKDLNTWQEEYKPHKMPNKNDVLVYGNYLAEASSCIGCHTYADKKGIFNKEIGLAGGFPFTINNRKDTIRSANITPDSTTGIGRWTKRDFIRRFKYFGTEEGKNILAKEGMPQSPMPWVFYSGMSEEDLGSLYEYLRLQKPIKNQVITFKPFK